jgi:hypothetical protein
MKDIGILALGKGSGVTTMKLQSPLKREQISDVMSRWSEPSDHRESIGEIECGTSVISTQQLWEQKSMVY